MILTIAASETLGIASLLFFFVFFVGVLIWVYRPGSKKKYKKWGKIPFKED